MSRRTLLALVAILLVALAGRAFVVARSAHQPLYSDELSYDEVGRNVAQGHGIVDDTGRPTARLSPGFVVWLGAVYAVAGPRPNAVRTAQALLDCLTCLLVFRIALRLFRREDTALLAALIYALYPPVLLHSAPAPTETLALFWITLAIAAYLEFAVGGRRRMIAASALAIGVTALVKPQMVLLPGVFFLARLAGGAPPARALRELALQALIAGLVVSPWIVRNAVVLHRFVPGQSQGGFTFWGGTGPAGGRVVGGLEEPWAPRAYVDSATRGMDQEQRDRWFYRDGLRVIRSDPGRYARVVLRKLPRLWFDVPKDEPSSFAAQGLGAFGLGAGAVGTARALFVIAHLLAIALAVVGIVRGRPAPVGTALLAWLVVYFSLIHMAFFAVFRYSLPVYAYLFCFTAAGLAALSPIRHPRVVPAGRAEGAA